MLFTVLSCKVAFVGKGKTDNIKPMKLYDYILAEEFKYQNLSMKFSAEASINGKKETFGGTIRIQKDSIIWISLRNVVEGVRLCFTSDSVKFINYLDKTYFSKDFDSLMRDFSIDIDYYSLQSILTNSFFFYPCVEDEDKAISNFKQCQDEFFYCMSSISERKYSKYYSDNVRSQRWERKLDREIKDTLNNKGANDFVFQTTKIVPEIYKIHSMYLENYIQQQSLFISYDQLVLEEQQYFPRIINVELKTPVVDFELKFNIESVNISTKPFSFPFKISDKYQEIKLP